MAVFVNTNTSSLHGQRFLNNVQNSLSTTYNRLSSGLRINSAKDDAAGLQIADRLTSQINGLNQGNRNASDGIALAQTIEGGLDEISNMLQRMRTLAVQSANGTNTADDRAAMQKEATALSSEIERIATQTTFGGKTVLAGYVAGTSIYGTGVDLSANGGDDVSGAKMVFQVGANQGDEITLNVYNFRFSFILSAANVEGESDESGSAGWMAAAEAGTTSGRISISSYDAAKSAITVLDKMIAQVDSQRGDLGAIQNRLESSIRNQSNVSANQADARARIRDTDFAEESANLTQQNIIQQAASSMLMQANMRPQLALSMLG